MTHPWPISIGTPIWAPHVPLLLTNPADTSGNGPECLWSSTLLIAPGLSSTLANQRISFPAGPSKLAQHLGEISTRPVTLAGQEGVNDRADC